MVLSLDRELTGVREAYQKMRDVSGADDVRLSYQQWSSDKIAELKYAAPYIAKKVLYIAPFFLTLYKPFGQAAAIGVGLLRSALTLNEFNVSLETLDQLPTRAAIQTLFEVAALLGSVFVHPAGMFISSLKDLVTEYNVVDTLLREDRYQEALESRAKVLNNVLYLGALASSGSFLPMASLASQVLISIYHAYKAKKNESYIEVVGHLSLALIQAVTLMRFNKAVPVKTETTAAGAVNSKKTLESDYQVHRNTAHYKYADWSALKSIRHDLSLQEAKKIADSDPEIAYFFHMDGGSMFLQT